MVAFDACTPIRDFLWPKRKSGTVSHDGPNGRQYPSMQRACTITPEKQLSDDLRVATNLSVAVVLCGQCGRMSNSE